jgi:hypothetical protein
LGIVLYHHTNNLDKALFHLKQAAGLNTASSNHEE